MFFNNLEFFGKKMGQYRVKIALGLNTLKDLQK